KPSKSSRNGIPDVIRKPQFAILIQNSTDLETSKRVRDRSRWYKRPFGLDSVGPERAVKAQHLVQLVKKSRYRYFVALVEDALTDAF
ncbi:hypothetical protein, partial [Rhizobium tubonense]|uniref:hypothetical protein n=1 Tax=Rhizobium tubonense TaxID=484088 RepID=UPI001FCE83AC